MTFHGRGRCEPRLAAFAEQHHRADRPDPPEQERHGRRVGVRDELDVGAEQALRVVPDPGEPREARVAADPSEHVGVREHEQGEQSADHHRPERAARPSLEGAVGVRVPHLVREQQDERDVRPPEGRVAEPERDHVDDRRAERHRERHPHPEPTVQADGPRADRHDHEVDREEPQRPERHGRPGRQHAAEQPGVAPQRGPGLRAGVREVQDHHHDRPDAEEHQRRAAAAGRSARG